MWPATFEERLLAWNQLRQETTGLDLSVTCMAINDWWWRAPMINQSLRWEDIDDWPDPWKLLGRDGWCDLARASGIMYTLMMLDRKDISSLELIGTNRGNLVQINSGIYILNWSPGELLNIHSPGLEIQKSVSSKKFVAKIG